MTLTLMTTPLCRPGASPNSGWCPWSLSTDEPPARDAGRRTEEHRGDRPHGQQGPGGQFPADAVFSRLVSTRLSAKRAEARRHPQRCRKLSRPQVRPPERSARTHLRTWPLLRRRRCFQPMVVPH